MKISSAHASLTAQIYRQLGPVCIGLARALVSVVPALLSLSAACSTASAPTSISCTPESESACACPNGESGSHRCVAQGNGYGVCRVSESQACSTAPLGQTATIDKCPGTILPISATTPQYQRGNTSTAKSKFAGRAGLCASGQNGNDHVYQVTPSATGRLKIELTPEVGFDAMVYVRSKCDDADKEVLCASSTTNGKTETGTLAVTAGVAYYIIVDGVGSANKGDYVLDMSLKDGPFCGDKILQEGEVCDTGAQAGSDEGCSQECTRIDGNPEAGNACPGQPVHLWKKNEPVTGIGATDTSNNPKAQSTWTDTGSSCTVGGSNPANERIYAVTPHQDGTLVVTGATRSAFDLMLIARTACDASSTQLSGYCKNAIKSATAPPQTEVLQLPAVRDTPIYIAVGGVLEQDVGSYAVTFVLK
jgi:hypothetical protein